MGCSGMMQTLLGGRDGCLVVDMTGFTAISYNNAAQTATIGSGWRLGPLYLALWNLGKVTIPAGNCVTVGVAGHALGGGWGFSSRKFGLVTDNILEAQLVTANGTLVIANAQQNSDLYFALRGAGANSYGIVVEFTFRVHDVSGPITRFQYFWTNKTQQFQAFKGFQTWGANAVPEISASFYLDPFGNSNIEGVYLGPQASLPPLIKSFLANTPPASSSTTQQSDWITLILQNGGFPTGSNPDVLNLKNYPLPTNTFKAKSIYVNAPAGLSDAGITAMLNSMHSDSNDNAFFLFDLYGPTSKINQVAADATAFVHRSSLFSIQMVAYWSIATQESTDFTFLDNSWNTVRPFATPQAYQNYIDRDMPLTAYYGSNLNPLIEIKQRWDSQNVFNFPQSIPLVVTWHITRTLERLQLLLPSLICLCIYIHVWLCPCCTVLLHMALNVSNAVIADYSEHLWISQWHVFCVCVFFFFWKCFTLERLVSVVRSLNTFFFFHVCVCPSCTSLLQIVLNLANEVIAHWSGVL